MKKAFKNFLKDGIIFRCADEGDEKLLFYFINHPKIRSYSYITKKIIYKEHVDWFEKKLRSRNSIIIIAESENNGTFIGQVRYDKISSDIAEVSVYLNPNFFSKGFGTKLLKYTSVLGFELLDVSELTAYIKKTNKISIKAFEKVGYEYIKSTKIKGYLSAVMRLKK